MTFESCINWGVSNFGKISYKVFEWYRSIICRINKRSKLFYSSINKNVTIFPFWDDILLEYQLLNQRCFKKERVFYFFLRDLYFTYLLLLLCLHCSPVERWNGFDWLIWSRIPIQNDHLYLNLDALGYRYSEYFNVSI